MCKLHDNLAPLYKNGCIIVTRTVAQNFCKTIVTFINDVTIKFVGWGGRNYGVVYQL